jgi:hypothetical protein
MDEITPEGEEENTQLTEKNTNVTAKSLESCHQDKLLILTRIASPRGAGTIPTLITWIPQF